MPCHTTPFYRYVGLCSSALGPLDKGHFGTNHFVPLSIERLSFFGGQNRLVIYDSEHVGPTRMSFILKYPLSEVLL